MSTATADRASTLQGAVDQLLEKHTNDDRHAMYKNAEVEAWRNWEKSNKDDTPQGRSWRAVATEISEQYHDCPWLKDPKAVVKLAVAAEEANKAAAKRAQAEADDEEG